MRNLTQSNFSKSNWSTFWFRYYIETPVLWPPHTKCWLIGKDWCWEGLEARGEGDDRGWDGWMASPTRCTWVWVTSGSWWWTERPGVLRFMGSQRVRHNWVTELNWTELSLYFSILYSLSCTPLPLSIPIGNHYFVLCISESVLLYSFICFIF